MSSKTAGLFPIASPRGMWYTENTTGPLKADKKVGDCSMSISSDLSGKAFWEKEACRLEMKTPASWYGDRAKDSLPCGNGLTGLLCPGGIAAEQLLLTRHDLWHQVVRAPLPDISHTLAQARSAIDGGIGKPATRLPARP